MHNNVAFARKTILLYRQAALFIIHLAFRWYPLDVRRHEASVGAKEFACRVEGLKRASYVKRWNASRKFAGCRFQP